MRKLQVKLTFTTPLLGTVPSSLSVARLIMDKLTAEDATKLQDQDETRTVFYSDGENLFLASYQIRGFLKESADTFKTELGVKNLKAKVEKWVFVEPRFIRLGFKQKEVLERSVRAMTAKGPRVAVVKSDMLEGASCVLQLLLVDNVGGLTIEVLKKLLDGGELIGIGQWRKAGFGRFTWEQFG